MATPTQTDAYRAWLKRWGFKDAPDTPEQMLAEYAGLTHAQRMWLSMVLAGIPCGGYAGEPR